MPVSRTKPDWPPTRLAERHDAPLASAGRFGSPLRRRRRYRTRLSGRQPIVGKPAAIARPSPLSGGMPVSVIRGPVAPGCASAEDPQHGFAEAAIVLDGASHFARAAGFGRRQRFQGMPFGAVEVARLMWSVHNGWCDTLKPPPPAGKISPSSSEALQESDPPFRVDVLDWHTLSPDFRAVIPRRYAVIQPPQPPAAPTTPAAPDSRRPPQQQNAPRPGLPYPANSHHPAKDAPR